MSAALQELTVDDLLNGGACFGGVMRFVHRTRLIVGKVADLLAAAVGDEDEFILRAANLNGDGYGNGNGDGYGDGNGDGNGYGDGNGDGNGYGDGYGNGYGDGGYFAGGD